MKWASNPSAITDTLISGVELGGKVAHYRSKQPIYSQGSPAYTLFYIEEGEVRLTNESRNRSPAITAILGEGDFFGAQCLVGFPLRLSTATAMGSSSIRTIDKEKMVRLLRTKNKIATSLVSYLLFSLKKYQDHVAELLTLSVEQRLVLVLLRLAHLDRNGPAMTEIPKPSDELLAEMTGATRSRVNWFMNDFRKQRYIGYGSHNGNLEVHQSLRKVLHHSR